MAFYIDGAIIARNQGLTTNGGVHFNAIMAKCRECGRGGFINEYRKQQLTTRKLNMSGLLHTLGWTLMSKTRKDARNGFGEKVCKELVIPLSKILYVQEHDGGKGDTCLVAISDMGALHVDIPFKRMKQILKEHYKNPDKDFVTHPDIFDDDADNPERHGNKYRQYYF